MRTCSYSTFCPVYHVLYSRGAPFELEYLAKYDDDDDDARAFSSRRLSFFFSRFAFFTRSELRSKLGY
jgi:hypothetical protein